MIWGVEMAIMRPLSKKHYSKAQGRCNIAALSIMDKVKCIIEMQRRLQPIYAQKQMNRQTISLIEL